MKPLAAKSQQELLESWLKQMPGTVAPGTSSKYQGIAQRFAASKWAARTTFTADDGAEYRATLVDAGLTPQTVNVHMTVLQQAIPAFK